MRKLSEAIIRYFDENEVPYRGSAEEGFAFEIRVRSAEVHLSIVADEGSGVTRIVVAIPVSMPAEHFSTVLMCLNRLNACLATGAWFVEGDDGWPCFRLAARILKTDDSDREISRLIERGLAIVDLAIEPLFALAFSGSDPLGAAAAIVARANGESDATLAVPANVRPELN